ncbi:SSD domain-containing protein [Citrus sinensis]|uniref:SSD domain-containing protein n=1 Tax=Citrus sinensis TaxID=2711 RepID=A0ACB8NRF8_CITSI|nr:SSD domain-containing protein [Citrus sinensis]
MKEVHAHILRLLGSRMVVVAVFLAFTVASIMVLSIKVEPGLEQHIVLPRYSYLQYLRVDPSLYFVVNNYNYILESRHTNKLCSIRRCDSSSHLNKISRASLIPELGHIAFGCCQKFVNGTYCPPDDKPPCRSPDDEEPCGVGVVCKDCTMKKLSWLMHYHLLNCAKDGHEACFSRVDLNVFYIFFQQYLDIWRINFVNIAIALAGAIFIVFLIITSSSSFILLVLVMMVNDLLVAVEFCVHMVHAFLLVLLSYENRDQRAQKALSTMNGIKIVSILVYYLQVFLALIIIGFLHGLVFLPVILSLFYPSSGHIIIRKAAS